MNVLVTGGTGFIGSHTVVELINKGYNPIIVDNLSNSSIDVLDKIKQITNVKPVFYEIDCTDYEKMEKIVTNENINAIIHFAGFKAVGESVSKPLMYYKNNILSTVVIAELADKYNIEKIIFSSSATVYGDQASPLSENAPLLKTTNPYGETKKMSERILEDLSNANKSLKITLLRYFNPIGAHRSGLIGENPKGIPNNLMPYVTQVAKGRREKLYVYGNDYKTNDGTGVRDYIHVVDLAKGHIAALEKASNSLNVYNLGTGKGVSVLGLVKTFETVNDMVIPYEIVSRRKGDLATVFADANKAYEELGWKTELTIDDMVKDAWNFEKSIK